ncbi:hypothetical protein [Kamptonema sp. UHCC 0994]|uniref:hypothetical protein n=1 Tax=Kamptonema sp. UHCC 0994 TaxID=3031329 RepID=UPI0023B92CFE|nr:hypothetical protein [Kamptonema sp. UHCC 0994]MDF0553873.1 hypothetical protein [Kamptonema sp. UHCC 0994]
MATNFISFIATEAYVPDRGLNGLAKGFTFKGRFSAPPGLNVTSIGAILTAVGGVTTTPGQKQACDASAIFTPRRLQFAFTDGGSLSVPIPDKADLITAGKAIKGALETNFGSGSVACVSLIGEHWGRLDEELRPTGTTPAAGPDTRAAAGTKNPTYSVSVLYNNDGGKTAAQSVRMATNTPGNVPFPPYAAAIQTALGTPLPGGCGSASNVNPRKYVIDFLTTDTDNPVRKMIIPVASATPANILAVGTALATNTQTLCLNYYGESDGRFSRFL